MAKYKPNKEKKSHVRKIQDYENGNFGKYGEATGGGHPFEAGNSNTRTTKENGKLRQSENAGKTNQPRTNDGKFTYKSVNGKSIDPKYGPSRGKTVNPLLTGGENGIKIEDVEEQFGSQSGSYWDKYKDKWHQAGGKVVTEGLQTKISAKEIWNLAKEKYDTVKGEFEGETENWQTKTGKKSDAEKAAIEKAQATGQQQNPIDASTGAIEVKGGFKKKMQDFAKSKKEPEQPEVEEKVQEQVQEKGQVSVNEEDKKPWGKDGKYTIGIKKAAINEAKQLLGADYDPTLWEDDASLEEFIDSNPEFLENIKKKLEGK